MERQLKREVKIGNVTIGGTNPVAVQTMLNVPIRDVEGNVAQAKRVAALGCQILRASVPTLEDVRIVEAIKNAVDIPFVADIHFDYRVNAGSLEKEILARYGAPTPEAMVESAMYHVRLLEKHDFNNIVISIKSSNVPRMMAAYRLLSQQCDYPLHVGVTEAGTYRMGLIKSGMGIGGLLLDGIGDTIRVSLTDEPEKEVLAGLDILRAAGHKVPGPEIISCPTCGRTNIPVANIAQQVEEELRRRGFNRSIKIAVMGCVVNGPGEAREADIGIAGGKDEALLFIKGERIRMLRGDIVGQLVDEVCRLG